MAAASAKRDGDGCALARPIAASSASTAFRSVDRERQAVAVVAHRERDRAHRRDLALGVDDQVQHGSSASVSSLRQAAGHVDRLRGARPRADPRDAAGAPAPRRLDDRQRPRRHRRGAAAEQHAEHEHSTNRETDTGHHDLLCERDQAPRQMAAAQESSQERRRRRGVRSRQQRVHVGAAGAGGGDRQAIDDLLAGELQLADEPPDGRMEPQQGEDRFLHQHPRPVLPPHVEQLVTEHRRPLFRATPRAARPAAARSRARRRRSPAARGRARSATRARVPSSAWSASTSSVVSASGSRRVSRDSRSRPTPSHSSRSTTPAASTPPAIARPRRARGDARVDRLDEAGGRAAQRHGRQLGGRRPQQRQPRQDEQRQQHDPAGGEAERRGQPQRREQRRQRADHERRLRGIEDQVGRASGPASHASSSRAAASSRSAASARSAPWRSGSPRSPGAAAAAGPRRRRRG